MNDNQDIANIFAVVVDQIPKDMLGCNCSKDQLKENFNNCIHTATAQSYLNTGVKEGKLDISFTIFELILKRIILDPPNYLNCIPNDLKIKLLIIKQLLSYASKLFKHNKVYKTN